MGERPRRTKLKVFGQALYKRLAGVEGVAPLTASAEAESFAKRSAGGDGAIRPVDGCDMGNPRRGFPICRAPSEANEPTPPPPLEGRGLSNFPPRRQLAGGGVINDSIHIFRQRKIWIPFNRSVRLAAKARIKLQTVLIIAKNSAGAFIFSDA